MYKGLLVVGRGIGQVMFQNNAFSGLLMLIGILCNSWVLALLAVVGNIVSTLTAYLVDIPGKIYAMVCMVSTGHWWAWRSGYSCG